MTSLQSILRIFVRVPKLQADPVFDYFVTSIGAIRIIGTDSGDVIYACVQISIYFPLGIYLFLRPTGKRGEGENGKFVQVILWHYFCHIMGFMGRIAVVCMAVNMDSETDLTYWQICTYWYTAILYIILGLLGR